MINFPENIPDNCLQLITVTPDNWDDVNAKLQCWQRENSTHIWQKHGNAMQCVVGKNGMAWGDFENQLRKPAHVLMKKEGDFKAPAGLFKLNEAYGYSEKFINQNYPYISVNENIVAVDDPNSKYYNCIINKNLVKKIDWESAENMLRDDGLYKYGIIINYNLNPAIAGRGSCIFMHIWRAQNSGTEGCTALSEDNLIEILKWLNFGHLPMLWQMPLDI